MMGVAVSSGRFTSGECIFSGYSPEASVTIQAARVPSQGADAALKTGAGIIGRRLPLETSQETRALRAAHPASEAGQFVAPDVPVGSEAEAVRTAP